MSNVHNPSVSTISGAIGIVIGAVLPAIFLGRAGLGVIAGLGLIVALLASDKQTLVGNALKAISTPLAFMILIIGLVWIVGAIGSPAPEKSVFAVSRTMIWTVVALIIWAHLVSHPRSSDLALKSLTAGAGILSLIAVVAIVALPELYSLTHGKGWTESNAALNYKETGSAVLLMIPLTMLLAFRNPGAWRWIGIATTATLIAVIFLTQSRAGVAGLTFGIILFPVMQALHRGFSRSTLYMFLAALVGIALVLVWLYFIRLDIAVPDVPTYLPVWLIDWHRQLIWSFAWELGDGMRWFGTGANAINLLPGADRVIVGESLVSTATDTAYLPAHPHNWVIEIALETGFIGLLALILAQITAVWGWLRRYISTGDHALLAVLAISAGYWGSGLFNFSYWSSWWQLSFFVATAICLSMRRQA